jgi:ribosomal protein L6P/L9E
MAKITWKGEDDQHKTVTPEGVTVESAGPSFTTCYNIKFPKGEAVEVTDPAIIAKAKNNSFFKVEDGESKRGPGRPPKLNLVEPT